MSPPGWRPVLGLAPADEYQVSRLDRFRAAHPGVVIGKADFGAWEGRIPGDAGETIAVRYTLRELLDRLDELTGPSG